VHKQQCINVITAENTIPLLLFTGHCLTTAGCCDFTTLPEQAVGEKMKHHTVTGTSQLTCTATNPDIQ
jgi:hypothetical protein